MEPGGSIPHSQGQPNNPYPEPNQPNFSYLKSIVILPQEFKNSNI